MLRITHATLNNLGPFKKSDIFFENDITILTGKNDVGKSILLNTLYSTLSGKFEQRNIENLQRTFDRGDNNDSAIDYMCELVIFDNEKDRGFTRQAFFSEKLRGKGTWKRDFDYKTGNTISTALPRDIELPRVVFFSPKHLIGDEIKLNDKNDFESDFIRLGFGDSSLANSLSGQSPLQQKTFLKKASAEILGRISAIMPDMELELDLSMSQSNSVLVSFKGSYDEIETGFSVRGEGLRKLIALATFVAASKDQQRPSILLIDEPENSLHPGAQRRFRNHLQEITHKYPVQIVYATHSPVMINASLPTQVRLIQRQGTELKISNLKDSGQQFNFHSLRDELGIFAGDSLLYGDVTIFVEGATEQNCLALVLCALEDSQVQGFESIRNLLSRCHILNSQGDNLERLYGVAKSQRTESVIFLDGDKTNMVVDFKSRHPDAKIVSLPAGTEFEQIVPKEKYLAALVEYLKEELGITADINAILKAEEELAALNVRKMFTKNVSQAIKDLYQKHGYNKPAVMLKAFRNCNPKDIKTEVLCQLVAEIRSRLERLSKH